MNRIESTRPARAMNTNEPAPITGGVSVVVAAMSVARRRGSVLILALAVLVASMFLVAVALGPISIPLDDVVLHLLALLGFDTDAPAATAPFVELRLQRAILAVGVGGALGLAGAALQGLFRNPLADPGLIGVSSGARLGATAFIVLGGASLVTTPLAAILLLPTAAFVGALLTMFAVRHLANRAGHTHVALLLLAGLAVTVFEEAAVGLLTAVADDEALRSATLWRLGSLGGATWPIALAVLGVTALGSALLFRLARPLDVMLLGESEAGYLGIRTEALKRGLVVTSALVVATATAFVGIIGFVGLVVPHLVRMIAGPGHKTLLPGSMLLGALLVLTADLVARTIAAPSELPIGVVTAFIGAPFFLWLVARRAP